MPQKPDRAKREVWRRRLRDFERGNATITEFCRRVGVPVWSFYYWRQRFQSETVAAASSGRRTGAATPTRSAHRARPSATQSRLNFVPIQITGQVSVEVNFPNGTRVTVPCQHRDAIDAVMAALVNHPQERRPC